MGWNLFNLKDYQGGVFLTLVMMGGLQTLVLMGGGGGKSAPPFFICVKNRISNEILYWGYK